MMKQTPALSVIVPTHKRAAILRTCLERLAAQTIRDDIEVIVVSDGHDDETAAMMQDTSVWPMPVLFIEIEKSQQGRARNVGIARASAPVCLLIGDDLFLEPGACEEHELAHAAMEYDGDSQVIVLGYTGWDPAIEITPVMRWLDQTGWQFGYPMLEPYREDFVPAHLQHRFTYTSHLSIPTRIARAHPFREDVTLYGWEDIEWGMRLRDAGVKLFYVPTAKAVHHHPLNLEQSLTRMETLGESAVVLSRLNPALDRLPKGLKRAAYDIIALLPTMRGKHASAFLRGIRREEATGA